MRITHTQIIELQKIILESNLSLDQFDEARNDDAVVFQFKKNYFNYEITKAAQNDFRINFLSIHSKKPQGYSSNWPGLVEHFTKWCVSISEDLESEKKIYKPDSSGVQVKVSYSMSTTIKKISPKFDLIFNQAFQAEEYGLNEICGLGYRKAFEFLIKDYVIRGMSKDEADQIKNMGINEVVKNHIRNAGIQLILHRVLWLGNDHAHYVPVWKTKTINDLKTLIYTTMSWIEANEELAKIHKQALKIEKSMPHKKK